MYAGNISYRSQGDGRYIVSVVHIYQLVDRCHDLSLENVLYLDKIKRVYSVQQCSYGEIPQNCVFSQCCRCSVFLGNTLSLMGIQIVIQINYTRSLWTLCLKILITRNSFLVWPVESPFLRPDNIGKRTSWLPSLRLRCLVTALC